MLKSGGEHASETTASGSDGARATGRTATRGQRAQTRWRSQIDYGELCTTKYSYRSKYTLYTTKSGRYAGLVAQRRRDVSDELDTRYGFLTHLEKNYLSDHSANCPDPLGPAGHLWTIEMLVQTSTECWEWLGVHSHLSEQFRYSPVRYISVSSTQTSEGRVCSNPATG